jgi:DNA topoisomerase-1
MPRRSIRRRWYLDQHGIRRIGSKESGFSYVRPDGKAVGDEKTLARIQKLRIPPAWQEVRIARGEGAPLQAVGLDKKGRTQYLYHAKFRQKQDEAKFQRVVHFGESLPKLRRRVHADLKKREPSRDCVLAAIVRLIDQGFFRVGNEKSAKHEETYGLTTVQTRHVRISGSTVRFSFVGKWKKKHDRAIGDADVAALVRRIRRIDGGEQGELFKFVQGSRVVDVKDRHVNEYIQSVIGDSFTAKDFRTWAGTLICSMSLALQGQAETKKMRKKRVKEAIDFTASMLGNTPTVCRTSYICPRLLDDYMEGRPFESLRKQPTGKAVPKLGLSLEERALLKFFRQTIADRRRSTRDRRLSSRPSDRRAA